MEAISNAPQRRVILLETDERAGLVANLAAACSERGVSLEIVTGSAHVLITFESDEETLGTLLPALRAVPGVTKALPYGVAA